jgi:hypothetical protein
VKKGTPAARSTGTRALGGRRAVPARPSRGRRRAPALRAQLDQARKDLQRADANYKQHIISEAEYQRQQTGLRAQQGGDSAAQPGATRPSAQPPPPAIRSTRPRSAPLWTGWSTTARAVEEGEMALMATMLEHPGTVLLDRLRQSVPWRPSSRRRDRRAPRSRSGGPRSYRSYGPSREEIRRRGSPRSAPSPWNQDRPRSTTPATSSGQGRGEEPARESNRPASPSPPHREPSGGKDEALAVRLQ